MNAKTRQQIAMHLTAIADLLTRDIDVEIDETPAKPDPVTEPYLFQPTVEPRDPLAHLRFLESLEGLSEVADYEELTGIFKKHGIDPGDIRKDSEAWCGKAMRLAIVAAGYDDPGVSYDRAINWKTYGIPAKDPNAPGTIVVYRSHVSCKTEDGGEIGGNVSDKVRVMPAGQNWFGSPVAHVQIA